MAFEHPPKVGEVFSRVIASILDAPLGRGVIEPPLFAFSFGFFFGI